MIGNLLYLIDSVLGAIAKKLCTVTVISCFMSRESFSHSYYFTCRHEIVGIGVVRRQIDEFLDVVDTFWLKPFDVNSVCQSTGVGYRKYSLIGLEFVDIVRMYVDLVVSDDIETKYWMNDPDDIYETERVLEGMIYQYLSCAGSKRRAKVLAFLENKIINFYYVNAKNSYERVKDMGK